MGRRSKSDVCVIYLRRMADPELVETIRGRIAKVDVDGLPMAEKSLEEFIAGTGFCLSPHRCATPSGPT